MSESDVMAEILKYDGRTSAADAQWSEPPTSFAAWVQDNACPISLDPDAPYDDLRPLAPVLANCRVAGLGEASHGSRELFQLKDRIVRWLVTEHGLTSVAFEAFPAPCWAVHDYICTGNGDAREAVANIYGGGYPWDTEEVLALVEWLRWHNARAERPVGFYGFDVYSTGSATMLLDYLQDVSSPLATGAKDVLAPFLSREDFKTFVSGDPDSRAPIIAAVDALVTDLRGTGSLDDDAFGRAWRHAGVVRQLARGAVDVQALDRATYRDTTMGETAAWLAEADGPAGKLAAWAHNGHLTRGTFFTSVHGMGKTLDTHFGADYRPVALTFGAGSFRGHDMDNGHRRRTFDLPAAPRGSLEGELAAAVDHDAYVIDLRSAPDDVAAWLRTPVPTRCLGAGHSDRPDVAAWLPDAVASSYDVVAFVRNTGPTTPLAPEPEGPLA